eukprot:ANDGO_07350.mRNA.1 hypothetical protein
MKIDRPLAVISVLTISTIIMLIAALGTMPWGLEMIKFKQFNNCEAKIVYGIQKTEVHLVNCYVNDDDTFSYTDSKCQDRDTCKMAQKAGNAAAACISLGIVITIIGLAATIALGSKNPERKVSFLKLGAALVGFAAFLCLLGCLLQGELKPKESDVEDRLRDDANKGAEIGPVEIYIGYGPSWVLAFVSSFFLVGIAGLLGFQAKQETYSAV